MAADANADVALVYTGQAAMLLQGGWVYCAFKADAPEFVDEGNLQLHRPSPPFRRVDGDPANIVGNPANFWSVSADADQEAQDTATSTSTTRSTTTSTSTPSLDAGAVPPVDGLEDKLAELDHADYLDFAYAMVQDAPHFQLSWDQALPAAQAQALLTNLSQIFLGEISSAGVRRPR